MNANVAARMILVGIIVMKSVRKLLLKSPLMLLTYIANNTRGNKRTPDKKIVKKLRKKLNFCTLARFLSSTKNTPKINEANIPSRKIFLMTKA